MNEILNATEGQLDELIRAFIQLLTTLSLLFTVIIGVFVVTLTITRWHRKKKKYLD